MKKIFTLNIGKNWWQGEIVCNYNLYTWVKILALIIAILSVLTGFFFLRCPACGKTLVRVMRPWQKDGCTCPNCRTKIKYI